MVPVERCRHKSKIDEMNTPTEKTKDKSYKSKKKYKQREETTQQVKDAGYSHQQIETLSGNKDHYYGIEHHHYLARERRRKSRSERNKRRERRKQIKKKIDPKEQSEFRRHVRRAQEITSRSVSVDHRSINAEAKPVTVITQNRLTRKVGLFNQGKKSSKILRDTIIIPESVQSRVEKDLKEILSHKSSTEGHSIVSVNESYKSLPCGSKDDEQTSHHESCCLPTTPSTKPSPSKSWASTSPESQVSGITKLPESPPWEEIGKEFDENLNVEEIFPEKEDYLSTVYGDLRKMIEIYGSSQEKSSQQLTTKSATEIPRKVSKSSVRRRLEDAFAREEAAANSTEFASKEHGLQPVRVGSLKDMPNPETGLTKLKSGGHQNKKKVVIMESNQIIYKKQTSTEELMNAMMDGLQFLKNADEVNKIWSTSRPQTNSRNLNENNTSKSNFYQTQDTSSNVGISVCHRRQQHSSITERHPESVGVAQEYFTSTSENRVNPAMRSDTHQRGWGRECLDGHHQQGKERLVHVDQIKSDVKMKAVTEDIFDSSTYHHPGVSSCPVTCAPDMSHDTLSPYLRRRQGQPFKRFRMMESSDTDDDDEDDELIPSWYMDVEPPKLSTIESPKFYPQKMF